MKKKEIIEFTVASAYLSSEYEQLSKKDIRFGDIEKREPDIIFKEHFIEVGAIYSKKSQLKIIKKVEAIKYLNEKLSSSIPLEYTIDISVKENPVISSKDEMKKLYPNLSKYVRNVVVWKSDKPLLGRRHKINLGFHDPFSNEIWFPKEDKKRIMFCAELLSLFNKSTNMSFSEMDKGVSEQLIELDDFSKPSLNIEKQKDSIIGNKILEKLQKDKYTGSCEMKTLLLHNYEYGKETNFTETKHWYADYRNLILSHVRLKIDENNSYNIYSKIIFVDFSQYYSLTEFDICDFKNIKGKQFNESQYGIISFKFLKCFF